MLMTPGPTQRALAIGLVALAYAGPLRAQTPAPSDPNDMTQDALLGVLPTQAAMPEPRVRGTCLSLPADPPNDRLDRSPSDSLVLARCDVIAYDSAKSGRGPWTIARYHWLSVFADSARAHRDSVTEEEVVLFEKMPPGLVRPIWHIRFVDAGDLAVWRSITPQPVRTLDGALLLAVERCVNGTGGCSQDFIRENSGGRWGAIRQVWLGQLPAGYAGRILHGTHIDPATLQGESGFYGPQDPNCCPSQVLKTSLALTGDSLVLRRQVVVRAP